VVTIGLLAWALHGVDARALLDHLRRANPWLMLATITLATGVFPIRAMRWRLMLRDASGAPLPLGPLWHATAIGFMANNLLQCGPESWPAPMPRGRSCGAVHDGARVDRGGTGVRRVDAGRPVHAGSTRPLVSTRCDDRQCATRGLARAGAALFAGVLVIGLLVVHRPAPWIALLARIAHAVVPARLADRVTHLAEGLVAGLDVLKSRAVCSAWPHGRSS